MQKYNFTHVMVGKYVAYMHRKIIFSLAFFELVLSYYFAVLDGDVENGSVMAGQVIGLVNEIKSTKDIIETIVNDANAVINNLK